MKQHKERIMVIMSIAIIVSFGISTFFSIYSLNIMIAENNREKAKVYADEINSRIESTFSESVAVSRSLDNVYIGEYVQNAEKYSDEKLSQVFGKYLSQVKETFGFSNAFITPVSTRKFYSEKGFLKYVDPDNPDDDWLDNFLATGSSYALNVDNDQVNGNQISVFINVRMENSEGKAVGVCGAAITMEGISKEIKEFESSEGYTVMLASKNGRIQVSSETNYQNVSLSKNSSDIYKNVTPEIKDLIDSCSSINNFKYLERNRDSFCIVKYIEPCQWYLIIDYNGKTLPSAYGMLLRNLAGCVLCLVVMLIIVNLVSNHINSKINDFRIKSEFDKLTGLGNRRAYDEKIHKIHEDKKSVEEITVAVLDINSLKWTNDNIGHAAGDELIQGAAENINEFFKDYGTAYRTGGDEFIVIMEEPVENIPELIAAFKKKVSQWKGNIVEKMSISIGIVSGSFYEYVSIDKLVELADKQMYEDKQRFYDENSGMDRRRR